MSSQEILPTVKELRLRRGWYQPELAQRADVSPQTIRKIEQGKKVSLVSRHRVANALEWNVEDINWEF